MQDFKAKLQEVLDVTHTRIKGRSWWRGIKLREIDRGITTIGEPSELRPLRQTAQPPLLAIVMGLGVAGGSSENY